MDWDEYLIRVQNLSDQPIRVTNIAVFDSLGTRIEIGGSRRQLIEGTKETARRYKDAGLKVKAGMGGGALASAGVAVSVVSTVVGGAAYAGAASAATFGAAVAGAVIVAPALVIGGIVRGMNNSKVNKHIESRQTLLPVVLQEEEEKSLDIFFPLAPSPRQVEITYADSQGDHTLIIDTHVALEGLHLAQADK